LVNCQIYIFGSMKFYSIFPCFCRILSLMNIRYFTAPAFGMQYVGYIKRRFYLYADRATLFLLAAPISKVLRPACSVAIRGCHAGRKRSTLPTWPSFVRLLLFFHQFAKKLDYRHISYRLLPIQAHAIFVLRNVCVYLQQLSVSLKNRLV
jgi:hypothetical protein